MTKTAIITPVWKRPEITKLCFENLAKTGCEVFIATSEEWVVDYVRGNGYDFTIVWTENDYLGRKKNELLRVALLDQFEWDQLLEVGSDNLLDLEKLDEYLSVPAPHYGTNCQYMYDTNNGKAKFVKVLNGRMWGTGRVVSREAVEAAFPLWDDTANEYLDAQANGALDKAGYGYSVVEHPIFTALKSDVNIHSYGRFDGKPVNVEKLKEKFPELAQL